MFFLALAGCRTAAELGPRLLPIRRSRELIDHLASRAADAENISIRGRMKYSGMIGSRKRRISGLDVVLILGKQGNVRLVCGILNRRLVDVLIAEGEYWAHLPGSKKLYRGETDGVFPKGEGLPGLLPGVTGKWFFFPDLELASDEQMSVSRRRKHYDVTITRGGVPARSLKVSTWSRTPEAAVIYDLDRPGRVLAAVRYVSFKLEGDRLMPRRLEIRLPRLDARAVLAVNDMNLKAKLKHPWRPPRKTKSTQVIEVGPKK